MTRYSGEGPGSGSPEVEERLTRLSREASELGSGREHRREHLVEAAEARGLERMKAEQAYDLAREVGLDPALALAVVREGIGFADLPGQPAAAEAADPAEPEWVDSPPDPREAFRERRLRQTFRRVRSLVEREGDVAGAVNALAGEPDLELYDY